MDKKTIKRLLVGEFSVRRLFRSAILIYAIVGVWAFFFSDRLIFQPRPSSYQDTNGFLKLSLTKSIQITGLYLPNPLAQYTILYSHGNGEDLGDLLPRLRQLQKMGFAVFAYDYQGYGTSQGQASEQGAYQEIQAAYGYLTQQLKIPRHQIIVYGRSVGGGPSVDLARREPVAALITESTFTAAFLAVTRIPIYPFDKFRNLDKIKNVRCPVLVIHGKADQVIPFSQGQQLFAAAQAPKLSFWVDQADHNDVVEVAGKKYEEILTQFVQLVQKTQSGTKVH